VLTRDPASSHHSKPSCPANTEVIMNSSRDSLRIALAEFIQQRLHVFSGTKFTEDVG